MSAQTYPIPAALTDCLDLLLAASNDECADVQLSEIRSYIISNVDAAGVAVNGPTGDVSLAASWTDIIDNTDTAKASRIPVSGDIPAAPETVVVVNGVPEQIVKERVFNCETGKVGTATEDMFRSMQHGKRKFRIWPVTRHGRILGGEEGIFVVCTMSEPEYTRGGEAIKLWKQKFVWFSKFSAPDSASPFTSFN